MFKNSNYNQNQQKKNKNKNESFISVLNCQFNNKTELQTYYNFFPTLHRLRII